MLMYAARSFAGGHNGRAPGARAKRVEDLMSTSTVTTEELVCRLEAMAARLGDQETRIAEQQAEIAQQRAEIGRMQAERPAPAVAAPGARQAGGKRTTDRRGLLRGLLAAGATAAALGASGPRPAHADARGTLVGASTSSYGLVATFGAGDD